MVTRISKIVNETPEFRIGINQNYYVYCTNKNNLINICNQIHKSPNSIYYNNKHKCFVIRVKLKTHKEKLLKIFKK